MTILRFAFGAVIGLVLAQILIVVHLAVCSVPVLNFITCFGLGAPAAWEQIFLTLVMPIMVGMNMAAKA
jgi:hypothetical protein